MEFTYSVTEKEYLHAWRLRLKPGARSRTLKTIVFWVFILVCLMLLREVVNHSAHTSAPDESAQPAIAKPAQPLPAILRNVAPFVVFAGVWVLLLVRLGPMQVRRLYRNDPLMQGQFTVNVTPDSFSMANTAGASSRSGWNLYEYWRENKELIILGQRSGTCFILCIGGLSQAQQAELRGILSAQLPKK